MPNDIVSDIQAAIVEAVKGQAKQFVEENLGAKQFLEDRAQRMAQLGQEYLKAADDAERKQILGDMQIVKQSALNEVVSVTLLATAETRSAFKAALTAAFDVLIKALPGIISALA